MYGYGLVGGCLCVWVVRGVPGHAEALHHLAGEADACARVDRDVHARDALAARHLRAQRRGEDVFVLCKEGLGVCMCVCVYREVRRVHVCVCVCI